jgi:hypothetical protein
MIAHLRAIAFALHTGEVSAAQRSVLQKSVAALGPNGLDWSAAIRREMELLNRPPWKESTLLGHITQAYVGALTDPTMLPRLQQMIASVPQSLQDAIPNPKRVLEEKQDLGDKLTQTRSLLP